MQPSPSSQKSTVRAPLPTTRELGTFFEQLSVSGSRPAILALVPGYADAFIPKSLSEEYPIILTDLADEACFNMAHEELLQHCHYVADSIAVSPQQAEIVELATRKQSADKQWFSFRSGRVTASRLKRVCRTQLSKPSVSLVKDICYPANHAFYSKATQWGCDHEQTARQQYCDLMNDTHENFAIRESGLSLHPDMPFFGATPDGIVSCDCCGEGILEVKCPFCKRSLHLAEAADDGKFCLQTTTDGTLHLKEAHQYYYQIQMQIAVCQKDYCDFVVWTEQDLHLERVEPNPEFWTNASNMATCFFKDVLLLELVGKYFSRPSSLPADDYTTAASDSVALSADALLKAIEYTAPASSEEHKCVSESPQ